MGTKIKTTKALYITPGKYKMRMTDYEEFKQSKFGAAVVAYFKVDTKGYEEGRLRRLLPTEATEGNITGRLIAAVYGSYEADWELDLDEMIGVPVIGVVEDFKGRKIVVSRIADFEPVPKEAPKVEPKAPPAPPKPTPPGGSPSA